MRRWLAAILLLLFSTHVASDLGRTATADEPLRPHALTIATKQGPRTVTLWLQAGYEISVFAQPGGALRMIAQAPTGDVLVSDMNGGRVLRLVDRDGNGVVEQVTPLLSGLNMPHGLAFAGDALFVAESHRILRLDAWDDPRTAREIIQLPDTNATGRNPNHKTRTLAMGPDERLYVSIGSYCDACVETDDRRAAIWRYNLDGTNGELVASGLRNAVGIAFEPGASRLWVTENGGNGLGEDLPPDEIDVIDAEGPAEHFGWPFCHGTRVVQPPLGSPEQCAQTTGAALDLPPHIAPLGLTFIAGASFPTEEHGDLLVAMHGSALRQNPVGYSLMRVPMHDGLPEPPVEFLRGWLVGDDSWGRPVQPYIVRDGSLLLTDDKAGVVYRVRPSAEMAPAR